MRCSRLWGAVDSIRRSVIPAGYAARSPTADARSNRLHRTLLATLATSDVTLTFPRGDLRVLLDPLDLDLRTRRHTTRLALGVGDEPVGAVGGVEDRVGAEPVTAW